METTYAGTPFDALVYLIQTFHVLAKSAAGADYLVVLANTGAADAPLVKISPGVKELLDSVLDLDTEALGDAIAAWARRAEGAESDGDDEDDGDGFVKLFQTTRGAMQSWTELEPEQRPKATYHPIGELPSSQLAVSGSQIVAHIANLMHAIAMAASHIPEAVLLFFVSHREQGAAQQFSYGASECLTELTPHYFGTDWRTLFDAVACGLEGDIRQLLTGEHVSPEPEQSSSQGEEEGPARRKSKLQEDRAKISVVIQDNLALFVPRYKHKAYISLPRLPLNLIKHGLTFVNWPRGVPVPGLTKIVAEDGSQKPVTFSALKKAHVDALLAGLTNLDDARRTKLVLASTLDDCDADGHPALFIEEELKPRRWYGVASFDEGGPAHWIEES